MRQALKRVPVAQQARSKARAYTFAAPVRGWVTNESLMASSPGAAQVLENWRPTRKGATLRGGSLQHAYIGEEQVRSLMEYATGTTQTMFAASDTSIFDITSPAIPTVAPTASVTDQTAGRYSHTMFSTVGGDFLVAVNGADRALLYDGAWQQVDAATKTLSFDAQSGAFTAGLTVTGGTSTATAVIVAVESDGTTGLLRVKTVTGTFADNETITDTSTGSATTNIPGGLGSLTAITGVETPTFRHVWSYRNRLFFVGDDKVAWYLPVDSIGGAALDISMAGVFRRGGKLLFGATWSLDAGDGLDDKCVFISEFGEAAIYEGSDPSDANDWRLVGLYDMTDPLGPNASMRAGGDLLVCTTTGLTPISAVIQKDPAALALSAVSNPIEPDWKDAAVSRSTRPWQIVKWPEKNIAIVAIPEDVPGSPEPSEWGTSVWGSFVWGITSEVQTANNPYCFVVNLETGAWAKYTGWDTQCIVYHDSAVFFGTAQGTIMRAESTGNDNGLPYVCRIAGRFEDMGQRGVTKHVLMSRAVFSYSIDFQSKLSVSTNYQLVWPSAPQASDPSGAGLWDAAIWDEATWSAREETRVRAEWNSIGRTGYTVATMIQVTCGSTPAPDAELVSIDMTYQTGGIVV